MKKMKRLAAFLLAALLCCTGTLAYAKDNFDVSFFTQNSEEFDVDVEDGFAFIETQFSNSLVSFNHIYENDYYSTIRCDILVPDYYKSSRYPILRTWINYAADKNLYIHSVSFILNGKEYLFEDVADSERVTKLGSGVKEMLLIKYGLDNIDFLSEIADVVAAMYDVDNLDDFRYPRMKMVLHGLSDVTAEVPDAFWVEMFVLMWGLIASNGLDTAIYNEYATPCTVKDVGMTL